MRVSRRRSAKRSRGAVTLFKKFWGLLGGQRGRVVTSLVTAGVTTGLALLPLYATKIVIDYVLINEQSIAGRPAWLKEILGFFGLAGDSRLGLLWLVVLASVGIALFNLVLGLWSRWQSTVAAKRVSVQARKMAFDHAVRLPLHRVYDIKSGGVASVLRDDAGGTGELVFSLLYNPLKAIIQLVGSLIVLAYIRWELLLGALAILPVVYLTHRTWISRIRPISATSATRGRRRTATPPRRSAGCAWCAPSTASAARAATFTENNHLMARQELFAWWWMRGIDAAWQVIIPVSVAGLLLFGGILGMKLGDNGKPMLSPGDLTAFLAYLLGLLQPIAMLANSATAFPEQPRRPGPHVGLARRTAGVRENTPARSTSTPPTSTATSAWKMSTTPTPSKAATSARATSSAATRCCTAWTWTSPPARPSPFVGPSGAGKTTLCNLIARFYDPTGGRVTLDGRDIREIDIDDFRGLLGIVEQDTFCSTARSPRTSPTAAAPRPAPTWCVPPGRPTRTALSRPSPRGTTPSSASAA